MRIDFAADVSRVNLIPHVSIRPGDAHVTLPLRQIAARLGTLATFPFEMPMTSGLSATWTAQKKDRRG